MYVEVCMKERFKLFGITITKKELKNSETSAQTIAGNTNVPYW